MLNESLRVIVCASSFLYTSYILHNLMYFFSNQNIHQNAFTQQPITDDTLTSTTLWYLLINLCLLSVFILQHSLMASDFMKNIFNKLKLDDIERCLYNVSSAFALCLLLDEWKIIPWINLWNIDTSNNNTLWLLFTTLHILGWGIIYGGCLMMDISELAGIKQVYYKICARPSPMVMKSKQLQRYYAHIRHPSFTGFLIILWVHPFMSLDRLLLALLLTIYMTFMWTVDKEDYNYHVDAYRRKQRELS